MTTIQSLSALEILDSRGNPTVSATVVLSDGSNGTAQVPSGASTGKHEAVELRDGDPARYAGKGVLRAVANIENQIAPALHGYAAVDQASIDRRMLELDGTLTRSRLGANAILAVSCAFARALASHRGLPLWRSLAATSKPGMPVPMINIISGGLHAGRQIEVQDFLVIPHGYETMTEKLQAAVAIHRATKISLEKKGYFLTGVADEGGWGPSLESNESALEVLSDILSNPAYAKKVSIAIDVASTHFYRNGLYEMRHENQSLDRGGMIDLLADWVNRYPIVSIEDGLQEDDWDGWVALTERLGSTTQLIGDDLFTTDPKRLQRGIDAGAANAVLVKMNQIGTLTETFEVLDLARKHGYRAVVSARSGETEDSFLADLAVASGAGQIKIGSITRSERLAKYNRLLFLDQNSVF